MSVCDIGSTAAQRTLIQVSRMDVVKVLRMEVGPQASKQGCWYFCKKVESEWSALHVRQEKGDKCPGLIDDVFVAQSLRCKIMLACI